ncbi:MAG: DUF5106 domain-containing protein [Tannerella sp.]|jgi:hypothetical protein|nr:DUF5106 domain-containing protein [Tannerella sp.]
MKKLLNILLLAASLSECFAQSHDSLIMRLMPDIPTSITVVSDRADYLAKHFWDKFDFADTATMLKDNLLERYFTEYLDVLNLTSGKETSDIMITLIKKSEKEPLAFNKLLEIAPRYLYNAESPFKDEEKLIPVLQYAVGSSLLGEYEQIRPRFMLDMMLKNRVGEKATDFEYTLVDGEKSSLYSISADYTILFFKDPHCDDCRALTKQLIVSPSINGLIGKGSLKILALYTLDDVEAWKKHASEVLHSWIYAHNADGAILNDILYDVKHYPTLYLLDKEKKVALKDTSIQQIEEYLNKVYGR